MLKRHHDNTNEFLISYSEYFLNHIYETATNGTGYLGGLLNSLKNHNMNLVGAFNNARDSFRNLSDTWNYWSSRKNNDTENP